MIEIVYFLICLAYQDKTESPHLSFPTFWALLVPPILVPMGPSTLKAPKATLSLMGSEALLESSIPWSIAPEAASPGLIFFPSS
jgi:hypothetical protein